MTEFTLEAADRLRRSVGDLTRTIQQLEGTPGGQIETLGFLYRDGAQTIAQLARRRRIRHQSMSSTVAELEAQRLVKRSPDPADGRGVLIELTEAGSAAIVTSRFNRSTLLHDAAARTLTADERSHLAATAELLEKLRADLTAP